MTIKELARLAGTSVATVSLVLSGKDRGRVGAVRRRAILALARARRYRRNLPARALAEGRTYRIGLCLEGALGDHPIIGQFSLHERLACAAARVQAAGYAIEIVQTPRGQAPTRLGADLAGRTVDGLLLLGWDAARARRVLETLAASGKPAVASGTRLEGARCTWTDVDRRGAVAAAARRLLGAERREVVLLDLRPGTEREARIAGFLDAAGPSLEGGGRAAVFALPERSPDGVMAMLNAVWARRPAARAFVLTDNDLADVVLFGLRRRGLAPGRDCRVIGFGDTALAALTRPRLSHYDLQVAEQARYGVAALIRAIRDPRRAPAPGRLFTAAYVPGGT